MCISTAGVNCICIWKRLTIAFIAKVLNVLELKDFRSISGDFCQQIVQDDDLSFGKCGSVYYQSLFSPFKVLLLTIGPFWQDSSNLVPNELELGRKAKKRELFFRFYLEVVYEHIAWNFADYMLGRWLLRKVKRINHGVHIFIFRFHIAQWFARDFI